jgi:hypothetical protein
MRWGPAVSLPAPFLDSLKLKLQSDEIPAWWADLAVREYVFVNLRILCGDCGA